MTAPLKIFNILSKILWGKTVDILNTFAIFCKQDQKQSHIIQAAESQAGEWTKSQNAGLLPVVGLVQSYEDRNFALKILILVYIKGKVKNIHFRKALACREEFGKT
jgi:hypothetical protein